MNNRLQTTFDGLTHWMVVVDREYKIVNANESFCKEVKKDRLQVIGKDSFEFKEILYGKGVENMMEEAFCKSEPEHREFEYGGRFLQMSTFPLQDNREKTNNILVMIKDLTHFMIREHQILHEGKMAAVGQLAAGVAHEIRNPLGIIRNYSYLIKNNMDDHEEIKKSIEVIESSVQRSSNIIDNLLNFSRVSSDEFRRVNLKKMIDNIIMLEKNILEKNNVKIDVECPETMRCCVNEESLKHIFINLISNAIDALPHGGEIRIGCEELKSVIMITFFDNGDGIGKEDLDNIFNPFFTTKPVGKGTGLGLYIVYNEVQKHGGKITVSSKAGEGTCFQVKLPCSHPQGGAIQ